MWFFGCVCRLFAYATINIAVAATAVVVGESKIEMELDQANSFIAMVPLFSYFQTYKHAECILADHIFDGYIFIFASAIRFAFGIYCYVSFFSGLISVMVCGAPVVGYFMRQNKYM